MDHDAENRESPKRHLLVALFALQASLIAAGLGVTGHLDARMVNDSHSYVEFPFDGFRAVFNHSRTIGYPVFLRACAAIAPLDESVALGHWLCYAAATAFFGFGLSTLWDSKWGCFFVCSSMLYSNIVYRYLDNIAPDLLATAAAIATMGVVLRMGQRMSRTNLLALALGVFACCQLRPAYLFMAPFAPLAVVGLRWIVDAPASRGAAWKVLVSAFAPTLTYCLLRFLIVGYLGLVSFGGNNFAGVASAMMDEETLESLGDDQREFATQVLERRQRYAAQHLDFPVGPVSSYIAIEDQFNAATWEICVPIALERNRQDWPRANQAMMRLAIGIVRAEPMRYSVWLLKALRRAVWMVAGEFAGNPLHQILCITWLGLYARLLWRRKRFEEHRPSSSHRTEDVFAALLFLSLLFCAAKIGLVILTSPPLGRFMDAAAVFLVTVPAYAVWRQATDVFWRTDIAGSTE